MIALKDETKWRFYFRQRLWACGRRLREWYNDDGCDAIEESMESSTRARVIWFTKQDFQRWTALSTYGSVCRHTLKHIPTCFYFTPQPTSVTHTCYLHVCVCLCVRVFERRNSSAGNVTLVPRIAVSLKLWDENSSTALLSSPSNSLPHVLSSHFKNISSVLFHDSFALSLLPSPLCSVFKVPAELLFI